MSYQEDTDYALECPMCWGPRDSCDCALNEAIEADLDALPDGGEMVDPCSDCHLAACSCRLGVLLRAAGMATVASEEDGDAVQER